MIPWNLLRCSICNRSVNVLKSPKIPILNRPIFRNVYESYIGRTVSDKIVRKLKLKDGVPNESELIYRAEYGIAYQGSYIGVMTFSITFPMWLIYMAYESNFKLPIYVGKDLELSSVFQVGLFISSISLIGIATAIILSRYALRIYRNPGDRYTAVYKNVAMQTVHQHFKRGEVKRIPDDDILPHQISRYVIKGRKTILHEEKFRRPSDFTYMIGLKVNIDDDDVHDSDEVC